MNGDVWRIYSAFERPAQDCLTDLEGYVHPTFMQPSEFVSTWQSTGDASAPFDYFTYHN